MPKISKYNGGYVIISLNDEDIYEKIERNLYKPILLTDIVINGIEKNDVFTTAYVEGTNIVFKDIYDKDITISNDNSVSIGNPKRLYRNTIFINDVYINTDNATSILVCFNSYKTFDNINDVIEYMNDVNNTYRNLDFKLWDYENDNALGFINKINTAGLTDFQTALFTAYFIPTLNGEALIKLTIDSRFEFTNTPV